MARAADDTLRFLQDAFRGHRHCPDDWYCCALCDAADHGGEPLGSHVGDGARTEGVCNCGASAWNARVEAMIASVITESLPARTTLQDLARYRIDEIVGTNAIRPGHYFALLRHGYSVLLIPTDDVPEARLLFPRAVVGVVDNRRPES